MRKKLSLLMCLCMISTIFPMTPLATDASGASTAGTQVWSEDFQSVNTGSFIASNGWQGLNSAFKFTNNGTSSRDVTVEEDTKGNRYLHYTMTSTGTSWCAQYMYIDVPAAAMDAANSNVFTFEADIRLDPYNAGTMNDGNSTYTEYNIGLFNTTDKTTNGAYFTLEANRADVSSAEGGVRINGDRTPANETKHKLPTDEAATDYTRALRPYAWNTYRFVVRKSSTGVYYTDVYLNGWYFYKIGQRVTTNNFKEVCIMINLSTGVKYGGLSLDNVRFYYGVTEADGADSAKGKFTVDKYDFNDLDAQTYDMADGEAYGLPIIQGENVDHNMGALRRYNIWEMKLDIAKGIGGKSAQDSSLGVSGNGRINFARQVNETAVSTIFSTPYATALAEGEALEIASDVMFNSTDEALTLQAATNCPGGNDRVAIQVTPNYYGHGHWQDLDDLENHRSEIIPGLPFGKWIRLKIVITRGASTTANRYSIYADNIAIVENADLEYWYTDESFMKITDKGIVYEKSENPETLTGDALKAGFMSMFFSGNASYDNITFNRYLGGQNYSADTQIPAILGANNPAGVMPSIRGKVFAGASTIDEILTQFGVASDAAVASYTVRDSSGNTVTDYNKAAGGNYIDIFTKGGEHLYVTLAANNEQQNITDAGTGTLGSFELGGIKAESANAGYGRLDKSIKLTNSTSAKISAKYTADSYENNVVEFSFLPDADTNFNFGYDLSLIAMADTGDRADARKNGNGMKRSYPEIITITGGKISTTTNGTPLAIGSYKVGEWTKVKLVFNHGGGNGVLMSVNDGEAVKVENGPWSYFYKLENVYLTLPAGKSVVVDDVKVIEGAKADVTAPTITSVNDAAGEILLKDHSIIVSDTLTGGHVMDVLSSAVTISSESAVIRCINKDGAVVSDSGNDNTIDKYVLVMNGIYTYYNVEFYSFDCIEINGNNATVTLVNRDIGDIGNAKLITAVYNGSSSQLKNCSITDLTFTEDENGVPCANVSNYTEPNSSVGDVVRYFVWNFDKLIPLCSSVKK